MDIRNVVIHDSARGIGFQQRTGGGTWANVSFTNVTVLRTKGIDGSNWWGYGEQLWITSLPENSTTGAVLGGIHNISFTDCYFEGEQGALVMSRGQGNSTGSLSGPGISGLTFNNVSVVVGVYGNATRPGYHDYRPQDEQPDHVQHNITGWWVEHAGPVTATGGSVAFVGPVQRFWQLNTCYDGTPDSMLVKWNVTCNPATVTRGE